MQNTVKNYEENKVYQPQIETVEDKISSILEFVYFDAKKEAPQYLQDTKVEAGGE